LSSDGIAELDTNLKAPAFLGRQFVYIEAFDLPDPKVFF